jgi:hypothetical protein
MADEAKPVADKQAEFVEYMKKLDEANAKLADKLTKDTDDFQLKMEALAGTTLSSYPTFQPFVGIGQIIAAVKQSAIDREIINTYLGALVSAGTADKADLIRSAVRKALGAS